MTKNYKILIYGLLALIILGLVAVFAFKASSTFLDKSNTGISAGYVCPTMGPVKEIIVKQDTFVPAMLQVKRCDQLRIINQDDHVHAVAFGEHDHHIHYPGFDDDKPLLPGTEVTFVLSQTGSLPMHDHLNDDIRGTLEIE